MTKAAPAVIGGKYRVIRPLGQGGMGSVYEAVDARGQRVAVKVLAKELASSPTLISRFERERKAISAIDTPHIARALDAGTDSATGCPFLAMELLEGEDLDRLLRRLGPLPVGLALRIAAQVCTALQKAHEARFLHRDIKPANLFIASQPGGRIVKLLDFGVAKAQPDVARAAADGLTRTGSMLGSPLYMSPEQARGYKDIDARSDLWSLGVVLYKMLSGRSPHEDTEELGELIVLICTELPAPIRSVAPWVPADVAAVVHRALRFSPAERFASAAEMLASLGALLPGGAAITEAMIRPLTEAEKAPVPEPPPMPASPMPASPMHASPMLANPALANPMLTNPMLANPMHAAGALSAAGPPPANFIAAPAPEPPRRAKWLWVAAVGLAVGIGAGVVAPRMIRPAAPVGPEGSAAPAAGAKERKVAVAIVPADAAVEVDGVTAPLSGGAVEITGALGSVHKVHVRAGSAEKNVRVVVSESGAVPSKIEVDRPGGP